MHQLDVDAPVRGLGEGGRAAVTLVRPLTCVSAHVGDQAVAVRERRLTRVANEGSLPSVLPGVGLQARALLELGAALRALEPPGVIVVVRFGVRTDVGPAVVLVADGALAGPAVFVLQHVVLQVRRPGEPLPAERAREGFLPQVDEALVGRQRALVHEALAAQGAGVLPDTHVDLEVLVAAAPRRVRFPALLASEFLQQSALAATAAGGRLPWPPASGGGFGVEVEVEGEQALRHRQEHTVQTDVGRDGFCLSLVTILNTFKSKIIHASSLPSPIVLYFSAQTPA